MNRAAALAPAAATPTRETRFAVSDMRCAGCMAKIEHGLAAVPGIHAARVNLTHKQVAIAHDETLSEGDLAAALGSIGFAASPVRHHAGADRSTHDVRELLKALGVAGFAAMNVMLLWLYGPARGEPYMQACSRA